MEIRGRREVDQVVGYRCDVCRRTCYKASGREALFSTERASLHARWGYYSDNKDLETHECDLCEDCYEKVKNFIERDLGGSVRVSSPDVKTQKFEREEPA